MADGRVSIEEGVVYGRGGGRDLLADVYRPPASDGPAPGVLLLHGGGWSGGDRTQLRGYGILLGRRGYVCVAPEYRLTGESPWPAQIHDVKAAMRWMRAAADELGVDPDRIAVEGNSAGAHLALLLAGTPGLDELEGDGGNPGVDTRVSAAVAVYPPTVLPAVPGQIDRRLMSDQRPDPGSPAGVASPITHVSGDFPPTMLIHGSADDLVPVQASQVMYDALVAAGVPTDLHVFSGQPHAFDSSPVFGRLCAEAMLVFLDRYVREPATA